MQQLNHKSLGEGPPLIILHGLFGMLDNWKTFAKEIQNQFKVYLVDQRNHGRSFHADEMDYSLMANDLNKFRERQGLEKASIMGQSMGGKTAMTFASKYPDKVHKLIVVDIAPKSYNPNHELIFKALRELPINDIDSRKEARQFLAKYIDEEGIRLFLLKNLSRKKDGGYRWKMNLDSIYQNYENILSALPDEASYEGPTLFINGKQSNYIQNEDKEVIRKHFPKSQLLTLKDAGHWVHVDQPKALKQAVLTFLGKS